MKPRHNNVFRGCFVKGNKQTNNPSLEIERLKVGPLFVSMFSTLYSFSTLWALETRIKTGVLNMNYDIYRVNYDIYRVNYDIYRVNYDKYRVNYDKYRVNYDKSLYLS